MHREDKWLQHLLKNHKQPKKHLGIGDDCAILHANHQPTVWSSDWLIQGIHVFEDACSEEAASKALGRNISDIVSMGACPQFYLNNIAISQKYSAFAHAFTDALGKLERQFNVQCIGGDTTWLNTSTPNYFVNISMVGTQQTPTKRWQRSAAKIGDIVYVTGEIGEAAWLTEKKKSDAAFRFPDRNRFYHLPCYIRLVELLFKHINGCIDVSDGLLRNLDIMLQASRCGAQLDDKKIPVYSALKNNQPLRENPLLNQGDDYELLLTAAPEKQTVIQEIAKKTNTSITAIGVITKNRKKIDWVV